MIIAIPAILANSIVTSLTPNLYCSKTFAENEGVSTLSLLSFIVHLCLRFIAFSDRKQCPFAKSMCV